MEVSQWCDGKVAGDNDVIIQHVPVVDGGCYATVCGSTGGDEGGDALGSKDQGEIGVDEGRIPVFFDEVFVVSGVQIGIFVPDLGAPGVHHADGD